MASVTGWTRLEPRTRSDNMTDALEARVHDPAWLLGRQWQFGEFQGSDSGSPISATIAATASRLTRYQPGPLDTDAAGEAYDGRTPLETMVEREPVRSPTDENLRLAAESGTHFLSTLATESQAAHDALRDEFTRVFVLDPSTLFAADLTDLRALTNRLSSSDLDSVSTFVREALTDETIQLIDAYESSDPGILDDSLRGALVDDLNGLLDEGTLYDETRFAGVALPDEATDLIAQAGEEDLPLHARTFLDRLLLAAAYPEAVRAETDRDPESVRYLRVVGRRIPDGTRLYDALRPAIPRETDGTVRLPDQLDIPEAHRDAVIAAARKWLAWYNGLFSEPTGKASTWQTEQLEFEFSVAAPTRDGERVLESTEYAGGALDWHDFSIRPEASLGAAEDASGDADDTTPISDRSVTVIPTPVEYRGMPAPRFWEFEERGVRFGEISAEPTDLPHLLLAEFALIYGNNWFVIPLDLPVGTLSRISSLQIKDTFGVELGPIEPVDHSTASADWRLFGLSGSDGAGPQELFLPPVLADRFESDPLEEVRFIRDETANLAWAIERTVAGLGGRPIDRAETEHRADTLPDRPVQDVMPEYHLASSIPDYWVPLVAVPDESDDRDRAIRLRRGGVLSTETLEASASRGRILESGSEFVLDEEAIPRDGVQVMRTYQHARDTDGRSYLWIGRQKRPGRGEGSSGLRFDYIEEGAAD